MSYITLLTHTHTLIHNKRHWNEHTSEKDLNEICRVKPGHGLRVREGGPREDLRIHMDVKDRWFTKGQSCSTSSTKTWPPPPRKKGRGLAPYFTSQTSISGSQLPLACPLSLRISSPPPFISLNAVPHSLPRHADRQTEKRLAPRPPRPPRRPSKAGRPGATAGPSGLSRRETFLLRLRC